MRLAPLLALLALAACDAPAVGGGDAPRFGPPAMPDVAPPARAAEPPVRAVAPPPVAAPGGHGTWNAAQIAWRSFDDGVAEARRTHKPMMLVFYASWCVHCANFSHVFDDAAVVAAARDFVMVRADSDHERALNDRFAPDGQYIPRTLFLSPEGELVASVKAHEGQFQYFYDERSPGPLLAAMRVARAPSR